MHKNAVLQVNLQNIAYNYNFMKNRMGHCGAVVKCNAYGLGAFPVVDYLINKTDCRNFFVSETNEAIEIFEIAKNTGSKIYIMSGFFDYELKTVWEHDFIPVCFSKEQINLWKQYCSERKQNKPIALQIETGLNRLGLSIDDFFRIKHILDEMNVDLVMHHLACGYEGFSTNEKQLEKINQITGYQKSLSSSCGALLEKQYHHGIARIGRFLYGSDEQSRDLPIKLAVTLTAHIISVKNVSKGEYIGYSQNYQAKEDIRIAIANIGYGDGYTVRTGYVFTNGSYASILSCSMDYLILDVTNIELLDDEVELIGEHITFTKLAEWNRSVKGLEIMCNLGSRVRRLYVN